MVTQSRSWPEPIAKTPLLLEKYLVVLIGSGRVALTAYLAPEHNDPQAHKRSEGGS